MSAFTLTCGPGDSLTFGTGDPNGNGWRRQLVANVIAARPDAQITCIGPNIGGDSPTNHFSATVGITVEGQQAVIPVQFGPGNPYSPNIMVVLIGTNNATTQALTTSFMTDYPAMMATLHSLLPNTGFVVSLLPPTLRKRVDFPSLPQQDLNDQINAALPGMWDTMEGSGYILERAYPTLVPPADYDPSEGGAATHPIPPGYQKLARTYTAPFLRLMTRMGL